MRADRKARSKLKKPLTYPRYAQSPTPSTRPSSIMPSMQRQVCEICDKEIDPHAHYVVRIDVFADPSMPATTGMELAATNFDAMMADLMEQMKGMSAEELSDAVHRRFEFKICPGCQARFLANPLGKPRVKSQGVQPAEN
jgi:hypothetical protein